MGLFDAFANKTFLVTGAGSLGSVLIREILARGAASVRVLDSDEYNLFKLKRSLEHDAQTQRLRLLLGNIRDYSRVRLAMARTDVVLHTAAAKNIEVSEYNPIEACRTNIEGTSVLVEAALDSPPEKFLYVSSDKAVHFSTLYGATKFAGERITLWADKINEKTRFSVVRMPNFKESRGNVFEIWKEEAAKHKPLSITDPLMERYFIGTQAACDFVLRVVETMKGGEIFVPKEGVQKARIMDLARERSQKVNIIGIRPGEKLSETLYTEDEKRHIREENGYLVIQT